MVTASRMPPQPSLDDQCERVIAQFEQGNIDDVIAFTREALERVPHALRPVLVVELARIDLEHRFIRDYLPELQWKPSQFYPAFQQLLKDGPLRAQVAFEHYRLARLYGAPVSRQQIGVLYGTSSDSWKELPLGNLSALQLRQTPQFPRVGDTFDGYPLIAELGRGALARVYLARQPDLAGRLVVLKVSGRLNAEADKLARLQHTNIVPVYSVHRGERQDEHDATSSLDPLKPLDPLKQLSPLNTLDPLYAICMPYLGSLTLADLLLLYEGRDSETCRIEELISTLVARRRSTLVNTIRQHDQRELSDSSPVELRVGQHEQTGDRNSVDETSLAPQSHVHDSDSSSSSLSCAVDRQLGYEELMGALHSLVKRPNDMRSACQLIEGVANGIAYAHSIGIVHRDLKPENVLIANDGRPVVLDFNLSDEPTNERPEIIGGTLPYMSLQQLQSLTGDNRVSPSDDVFAIGTIFYRLLTGRLPFATHSIEHLSRLIEERQKPPAPVSKLASHVPASLSSIVMKCLDANESRRYPSAKELSEDLFCFREHRTLRHAVDRSVTERAGRIVKRHPVIVSTSFLTTIAVALLTMLGGSWWWATLRAQRLTQQLHLQQLSAAMPEVLAKLHGPYREATELRRGLAEATQTLAEWHISAEGGDTNQQLRLLTPVERSRALQRLGQLSFAIASAEGNLSLLETDSTARDLHVNSALAWNRTAAELSPQIIAACRYQRMQLLPESPPALLEKPSSDDEALANTPLAQLLLARQSGDVGSWLQWAELMTNDQPDDATAWFNFGAAQFTAGNFDRAWVCFDVAAKLQVTAINSVFWRGVASHQLGNYADALADFERCVQADSTWAAARHNRALAAFALQKLDAALADTKTLIDQQSAGPRVWLLRAQINRLKGNTELAQQDRQAALIAKCLSADDWVAIGVQKIASSPEEALAAFRKAHQLEPTNIAALQNGAHVLSEQLQQPDQAIESMTRLIALRPKEAGNYATRGILSARLAREADALQDAEQAARMQPKAIEMLQLAGVYSLLSRCSEAKKDRYISQSLDWMRRALAKDPQLVPMVDQDPDTEAVRDDANCEKILASARELMGR